jgi:hypothetical protein
LFGTAGSDDRCGDGRASTQAITMVAMLMPASSPTVRRASIVANARSFNTALDGAQHEAIEKANSVPYGLAAYAFTNSARNVDRLADGVEVGNLSINHFVASSAETPFGGVKDCSFGREGGTEGLQCYTVVQNVSHLTV